MTRRITYYNQLANSLFQLQNWKEDMVEKSKLAQAILGVDTLIDGFNCTPTSPLSLNVSLSPITVFYYEFTDASPFGQLPSQIPADNNQILKLAYDNSPTVANFVPPGTAGFSRKDLIQVAFIEQDTDPTNLPFYNPANPSVPIMQTKNVLRSTEVVIDVKQGVAATTGTEVAPSPDPGYIGAWVITTANGQTTITSGNIAKYQEPYNQFIDEKLQDKISLATADERYVINQNFYKFRVTKSADQSFSGNASTKITFDTDSGGNNYNIGGYFNTTNSRFLPNAAGYYSLSAQIQVNDFLADTVFSISIIKNGTDIVGHISSSSSTSIDMVATAIANIYLNGSSDYVEVFVEVNAAGTFQIQDLLTVFSGFRYI